ncbi:MAG: hypothetical protein IJI37_00845, partial [Opitutales bacterium]|nr:hypothetical protein [Opitutales bacterium]
QEDSDRREILETQSDIAKIASGQGVNAPEKANAQLRLQILQTYASQPDVAGRVANDEFFRERLDAYTRQLQFSMQQAENAVIGRLGAAPQQFEPADMEETPNG